MGMMTNTGAIVAAAMFLFPVATLQAAEPWPVLTGDIGIHDPSAIFVDGSYVAFGTGAAPFGRGAIRIKTSPDGIAWTDAGFIGEGVPAWVRPAIGVQPSELWAPTISRLGERFFLYYSASRFGVNTSTIGLAINDHFDPLHPADGWEDQGLVVATTTTDDFNAIDPSRIDTPDGRAWLAFGSFWSGIKMRELDPVGGKLKAGAETLHSLASRGRGAIEAPSLLRHGDYYYLFVSFDRCCAGVASTYRIIVGRSDAVIGPYVDREGRPLLAAGGTQLAATTGRFIGPGGQEAFTTPAGDLIVFHYYDGDGAGIPKLAMTTIRWTMDGWPEFDIPNSD
jgi:arabinan endo-1,5-alpha-L-arabinosidase